jgi:large subunit ribosomal protein L30|tara:strand:- start:1689 stop:1925 length:237 start_codon:yes stop_codon:yes gene_type:complete
VDCQSKKQRHRLFETIKMASKIKVTQIRSRIGAQKKQKACLSGLGLRKINNFSVLENTPAVRGMIKKVAHLVRIETAG